MKLINIIISLLFLINIYGCDNKITTANIVINNGLKGVDLKIDNEVIGSFDKYKNVEIKLPLGEYTISQELDLGKYNEFDKGSLLIFKSLVKLNKPKEKIMVNLNTNIFELSDNLIYKPSDNVISYTKKLQDKYPILNSKAIIKISKDGSKNNGNTIFFRIDNNGYRWKMVSNTPFYDLNNKKLENTGILVETETGFGIAISTTQIKEFNNVKMSIDGNCFQSVVNKHDNVDTYCKLNLNNE